MKKAKEEKIIVRVPKATKKWIQRVANKDFEGNISLYVRSILLEAQRSDEAAGLTRKEASNESSEAATEAKTHDDPAGIRTP